MQQDLFCIIGRFRTHRYAFIADIQKTYRQFLIRPSRRDLQRILWKDSVSVSIKTYQLKTVTYETTSVPFLAMRTLKVFLKMKARTSH